VNEWVIGFKNGNRIVVKLQDGPKLIQEFVKSLQMSSSAKHHWYAEQQMLVKVDEVDFVLPMSAIIQ
jgi:hypothetical protein